MEVFWIFVWLLCLGIAIFGGEGIGMWSTGRKIAAFIAVLFPFVLMAYYV